MAIGLTSTASRFSSPYSTITNFSASYDAGTAARRVLVVEIHVSDVGGSQPDVTGNVTYNSVAMTHAVSGVHTYAAGANTQRHKVYYLANPASGSNTLAFSFDSSCSKAIVHAYVLADCDGIVSGQIASGGGNLSSYALTPPSSTVSGNWLSGGCGSVAARSWNMTTGTDIIGTPNLTDAEVLSGYESATGGTDTWDASGNGSAARGAGAMAEFNEDTGAGGRTTRNTDPYPLGVRHGESFMMPGIIGNLREALQSL